MLMYLNFISYEILLITYGDNSIDTSIRFFRTISLLIFYS